MPWSFIASGFCAVDLSVYAQSEELNMSNVSMYALIKLWLSCINCFK